jgi:hypothetical protein
MRQRTAAGPQRVLAAYLVRNGRIMGSRMHQVGVIVLEGRTIQSCWKYSKTPTRCRLLGKSGSQMERQAKAQGYYTDRIYIDPELSRLVRARRNAYQ